MMQNPHYQMTQNNCNQKKIKNQTVLKIVPSPFVSVWETLRWKLTIELINMIKI